MIVYKTLQMQGFIVNRNPGSAGVFCKIDLEKNAGFWENFSFFKSVSYPKVNVYVHVFGVRVEIEETAIPLALDYG